MDLFFAGGEQRVWRTFLGNQGVEHVSLSYIGLLRRIKDPSNWRIADNFPDGMKVYLDAGTFTLNKADSDVDRDGAAELANNYYEFVMANLDRIEFASEFDALVLGQWGIREIREGQGLLGEEKIMPVWHSEWGVGTLRDMASASPRVGVLQKDTDSGDITQVLRQLSGETKLHGVAMTKMGPMREIPWSSVGSTSWLSTTMHGDTFVWSGRELHRYPKNEKDRARRRHRTWLSDQGFDVEKIEADDNAELLRLSVWSWKNFVASLDKGRGVTISSLAPFGENEERTPDAVVPLGTPMGNGELAPRDVKRLLPVVGFTFQKSVDADGTEVETPIMEVPASGLLQCDTCYMRDKCPAMTPGSECVYEIPVKVRTQSQLAAVQDSLIEMQTQRVLYMRMVEMAEGGYADVNLSAEMNMLARMIKAKQEAAKEGFSLTISGQATPGGPGMISRIFGTDVTSKMGELPAPVDSKDVWEAEVIGETQDKRSN